MNKPTSNMINILMIDPTACVRVSLTSRWYVDSELQIEDTTAETRRPLRVFGTTPESAIDTFYSYMIGMGNDTNCYLRHGLHRYRWNEKRMDFDTWILKEL